MLPWRSGAARAALAIGDDINTRKQLTNALTDRRP